jgi:NAD(P)H dehydrogenase (quinone)
MKEKVLIIYAHPNPKSLNHAILEAVTSALIARGAEARVRDLYAMRFDPVLRADELADRHKLSPDIAEAQADVSWADTLIFIYPIWWTDRPAILKGWFDRVFTNGFAFSTKGGWRGLLNGRKAIVLQTAGGSEEELKKMMQPAMDRVMKEGTFGFVGITDVTIKTFYSVVSQSEAERQRILEEVTAIIR